MDFIKHVKEKFPKVLKFVGIVLGILVVIVLIFSFFSNFIGGTMGIGSRNSNNSSMMIPQVNFDNSSFTNNSLKESGAINSNSYKPKQLETGTTGNNAENFEVTQYNVKFEKENSKPVCEKISDLKTRADIIFEEANDFDHGCVYKFKTTKSAEVEVYTLLNSLAPKQLSKSTQTIKGTIENLVTETDILKKKQETIDSTLSSAVAAYNDIIKISVANNQVEVLSKVIESKLSTVERLTRESINVVNELNRIERNKATQIDRLEYTYFSVNVGENRLFDGTAIGDSWKQEIRNFVRSVNETVQSLTINLVSLAFAVLMYAVYALLIVIVAKYLLKLVKKIWKD